MTLTEQQRELCTSSRWDSSDLRALYVNCTLKPSPGLSHTQGLMDVSVAIMEANGVMVDQFRAVDHAIVEAADILVLGSPIWLGSAISVRSGMQAAGSTSRTPNTASRVSGSRLRPACRCGSRPPCTR